MVTLREYYASQDVSIDALLQLNNELQIHSLSSITNNVHAMRLESLNQAKSELWPHGPSLTGEQIKNEVQELNQFTDQWIREKSPVYKIRNCVIGAARPGKEAASDYNRINHYIHCTCEQCRNGNRVMGVRNPHDMFPYVERENTLLSVKRRQLRDGRVKVTPWTFEHIFSLIEDAFDHKELQFALEIFGSIIVRAAFMLDHTKDEDGVIKLQLPQLATELMVDRLPALGDDEFYVPIEAVVYFLDILGFNEDIKVDVCGYRNLQREYARGTKPQDNGRTNTLLTISHMLAAILHRRPIGEFAYGLHRGMGMNPISKGQIYSAFPLLDPDLQSKLDSQTSVLSWSPL